MPANLCAFLPIATNLPYLKFLAAYSGAVSKRLGLAADPAQMEVAYRNVMPLLGENIVSFETAPWRGRVLEGIAYAQLKQGNLKTAGETIGEARENDGASAFVALTELKIACASRHEARKVASMFDAAQQRLQQAAQDTLHSGANAKSQAYAKLELYYLNQDQELQIYCAFANLRQDRTMALPTIPG